MQYFIIRAAERGHKDGGWLQSNFVLSFSNYQHPLRSAFGTLVALNDDTMLPGKGFGNHPHVNMEIISVLLKGRMNHKDSMGHNNVMEAGAVQIMSAGSGLFHEEYNVGDEQVHFLQLWIQPKLQNIMPRYQYRNFPAEKRRNKLQTIISHQEGMEHCWINQNARLSLGYFDAGQTCAYTLEPENMCVLVYVIAGRCMVNGQTLEVNDSIGLWKVSEIAIETLEVCHFLVVETVINQK